LPWNEKSTNIGCKEFNTFYTNNAIALKKEEEHD
jgi:hypothetical protein